VIEPSDRCETILENHILAAELMVVLIQFHHLTHFQKKKNTQLMIPKTLYY